MELVGDKHYECVHCGQPYTDVDYHHCPINDDARLVRIEAKLQEILDQQRWLERVILERLG